MAIDPATVTVFSAQEVCDLASADDVASAVGGDVDSVSPSTGSTPQCVYNLTIGDQRLSVTTACSVPRRISRKCRCRGASDVATAVVPFDTPYEAIGGIGDLAAMSSSETFTSLVVLAGDQVFTVAGAGVDEEQVLAIAGVMAGAAEV